MEKELEKNTAPPPPPPPKKKEKKKKETRLPKRRNTTFKTVSTDTEVVISTAKARIK